LTRRDVVDLFQPQERAVLPQSMAPKQAQPYCVGGPAGRLLDAEAKQLGSASVRLL
jgi:hypothetical protein